MTLKVTYTDIESPSPLTVRLPLSKSLSNRLLIINALAGQSTPADYVAQCDDTDAMLRALASQEDVINVGAAGTAMRFLTAYFATRPGRRVTLDGSERMRQRPIGALVDALKLLGADIRYLGREGFPPLLINGRQLEGGGVSIDAGISSQYISALIMTGPTMKLGLELTLKGEIVSRPYIDMTLRMIEDRGALVSMHDLGADCKEIRLAPRLYLIDNGQSPVEADWSAALYWYEIAALTGRELFLPGLRRDSLQGDSMVKDIFYNLGVETRYEHDGVTIARVDAVDDTTLEVDMTDCPDAAQTVAATCCGLGKKFVITGLSTLPIKETDRLAAMQTELGRLGYSLRVINNDTLAWDGTRCEREQNPVIATYHDHRMAMAIAPLTAVTGDMEIENPGVVSKSYPDYWNQLSFAGYLSKDKA